MVVCHLESWSPGLLEAHDMYGLYALTELEYQTRGDSESQRGTFAARPTHNPINN